MTGRDAARDELATLIANANRLSYDASDFLNAADALSVAEDGEQ